MLQSELTHLQDQLRHKDDELRRKDEEIARLQAQLLASAAGADAAAPAPDAGQTEAAAPSPDAVISSQPAADGLMQSFRMLGQRISSTFMQTSTEQSTKSGRVLLPPPLPEVDVPDDMPLPSLRSLSGGERGYNVGRWLTMRRPQGGWDDAQVEAEVVADGTVQLSGASVKLNAWNHAPRHLPHASFETLRLWYLRTMRLLHSHIADPLSGKRCDALLTSIPIVASDAALAAVVDVRSLHAWMVAQHAECVAHGVSGSPCRVLLTASPAGGKTTLLSQLVALSLDGELVPIVIKASKLHAALLANRDAFATAWNFVDAYLCLEEPAPVYRFLRQALAARRALLLLDGLDDTGRAQDEIETHVAEVLAPQGHMVLATARPMGSDLEGRFRAFHHLTLTLLTDAQQAEALKQRLGPARAATLLPYWRDTVPNDREHGHKITAHPLMLSMVASVSQQLHVGVEMPANLSELYEIATHAMLSLNEDSSVLPHLTALLQAVFLEAHVAQRRIIEQSDLQVAAIGLASPKLLRRLRLRVIAEAPFEPCGEVAEHHVVEVRLGATMGRRGICKALRDRSTTASVQARVALFPDEQHGAETVQIDNVAVSLVSSGMDELAFLTHAMKWEGADLEATCTDLPPETQGALRTLQERVTGGRLPLLSLLHVDPLQIQASHISFQEYYVARAICSGLRVPSRPWAWPAWWANVLRLGKGMGEPFRRGLIKGAQVNDEALQLHEVLQPLEEANRQSALLVLQMLVHEIPTVDISDNGLTGADVASLATDLQESTVLTSITFDRGSPLPVKQLKGTEPIDDLDLSHRHLGALSGVGIAKLIAPNEALTSLNLHNNKLGPEGGAAIASALRVNRKLTSLNLQANELGVEGGEAIAEALRLGVPALVSLNLSYNKLRPDGARALAEALASTGSPALQTCDVRVNLLNDAAEQALQEAVKARAAFTLQV